MTIDDLTAPQAEALRLLVHNDESWQTGTSTSLTEATVNGRVVAALREAGLVTLSGSTVEVTDAGRDLVAAEEGEALTGDGSGEALPPLPDDAYPEGAQPLNLEGEGDAEGEAADPDPSTPRRLFEGLQILGDEVKVTAGSLEGGADLRHGDRAIIVSVAYVVDVRHPGDDVGVIRTPIARPKRSYLMDAEDGDALVDALARIAARRAAGSPTLLDPDDDPQRDVDELVARLNRAELEARDDRGIRDWDEADEAERQAIRDQLTDDWTPCRSLNVVRLRELWHAGEIAVDPEWWIDPSQDSGMEPEQEAQVVPHAKLISTATRESMDVLDALESAEAGHPEVRLSLAGVGQWMASAPADLELGLEDAQWRGVDDAKAATVESAQLAGWRITGWRMDGGDVVGRLTPREEVA